MGNAASCSPAITSTKTIKVVSGEGRLQQFRGPLKAAELMLDNPRHFVCDSGDLRVGHRVPCLAADDDLEPRRPYLLLPMDMLFSVLTSEEMGRLSAKAALKWGGASANIGRIFPVFGDSCLFPSEAKAARGAAPAERCSRQRSWQPALATIVETPTRV